MKFLSSIFTTLSFVCISLCAADEPPKPSAEQLKFFEDRIRPVLIEHCYECHSEEAASLGKLRGQLKLDSRPAGLRGGESGAAIVPGKTSESLVLSALRYEDFEMPPKGKLPDNIVKDFETWIAQGAADPRLDERPAKTVPTIDYEAGKKFWSFQRLARPALPTLPQDVATKGRAINPIDAFVIAKQSEVSATMRPTASARILVRRAWLDLLGIPPTPTEMQLWIDRLNAPNSNAANKPTAHDSRLTSINSKAWSELISHLLDRPQYGERWARHWMDVARFAESYGYEQDYDRPNAYHYRDFLIRAFNSDMPYDQFVQWQIAGDEISPQLPDAWMATGFLSAGAFPTQLTEVEFESTRYDELDDMVSTTSQAFLGLSVGCARCHDHKFDPISAEDYYGMASVFGSAIRCETKLDLDPQRSQQVLADYQRQLTDRRQKLTDYEANDLKSEFRKWLKSPAANELSPADPWEKLDGNLASAKGKYKLLEDGAYLGQGKAPNQDTLTFRSIDLKNAIHSIRIEALSDPSLPHGGPGRADNGNFALGDIRVKWHRNGEPAMEIKLKSARATHQQDQSSLSIAASIDEDPVSGWAVDGQIGKNQAAAFELSEPIVADKPGQLEITLAFNHPNAKHILGKLRLSVSSLANAPLTVGSTGPTMAVRTAIESLQKLADLTTAEQDAKTRESWDTGLQWYRQQSQQWIALNDAVVALEKQGPPNTTQSVQVTSEGLPILNHHANDRGFPHFYPETYLLRRGDVHQRVRVAEPSVPRVLNRQGEARLISANSSEQRLNQKSSYRRTVLAQWLTDTENGGGAIAARVMANRLWQHHFGTGIVATPNDFGATGDRPTHPELLEWLACDLVDGKWKLKSLHHAIMSSQTYMQAGLGQHAGPTAARTDAQVEVDPSNKLLRYRSLRRLDAESIRDSMLSVSGLLDATMFGPGSLDSHMRRRSIYFFIKRSQLIQPMILMDWPEHLVSIGRRQVTTIAPQSLQFMNAQWVRDCAAGLANRGLASSKQADGGKTPPLENALREIHRLALCREITDRELTAAVQFVKSSQQKTGPEAGNATSELSALTDYCHAILSLNEFIYVE
jgi:Protein of unknown function (DUF1549)/Protein of unknown function (DUF1553)/Planctomycete cytochrome C